MSFSIQKAFNGLTVWSIASAIVCSLVFAVATVYGGALFATGYFAESADGLMPSFFAVWVASFLVLIAVSALINAVRAHGVQHEGADFDGAHLAIAPSFSKRSIVLHALVMLAFWTIYIVAMFPGSMNWDTYYQISQWYPGNPVWMIPWIDSGSIVDAHFSDHHPLFDTLLYGLFAVPSDVLFGTWNYGVFVFIVLQSAFTAIALTASSAYLRRIGAPSAVSAAAFCFYCIMPFFPFSAATMLKDTLFSPLFVVYALMICEVARTKGAFPGGCKRDVAAFAAVGLLVALTKKPGLYIVLATCVVLALVYRRALKAFATQFLAVVLIMFLVMPLMVFPLLDVIPGGKQEALGLLFQQTARYIAQHPDDVSPEERDAIDRVIMLDGVEDRYNPFNSDPIKFSYRYDTCTSQDITDYISVWFSQGLRHPAAYIEATLVTSSPYADLLAPINVIGNTADVEHDGSDKLSNPEMLRPLREGLVGIYGFLSGAPVVSLLFRIGLYSFVIPSMSLVTLAGRRSGYLPALVPIILSILVCFVSPVVDARYALPLVYLAPVLVGLCFANEGV